MTDPLGDMLTRIRNAQMRGKDTVYTPASQMRGAVLGVLAEEGYIAGYTPVGEGPQAGFEVQLKYHANKPVIREIKRISKPGWRVYASVEKMPLVYNGLGISILSTSKGIMSDSAARQMNVGGEILCEVF